MAVQSVTKQNVRNREITSTITSLSLLVQRDWLSDCNWEWSPSLFYLLTAGVEVVYFHLVTLRHTPHSAGLLWTRDRPVAETSTWQHKHSK
jgi:hypothetical protein